MNEIKKCSISGVAFTFEKVAYNRLSEYIDSLKRAYKNSTECDEIIADIEARIAELILSAQSDQSQVVCLPLIENIIAQLGTAEDISGDDEPAAPATDTRITRRLYRDMDNSKLGGVCSGLGKYFNIDPVWVRLAIFAPLITSEKVPSPPHAYSRTGQGLAACSRVNSMASFSHAVLWMT